MMPHDDKPAPGPDPAAGCCVCAEGSAGYASPPCYAHEFPAYFGDDENEGGFTDPPSAAPADTTGATPRRPPQGQSA